MATLSGGQRLEKYLNDLARNLTKASTLEVGFMENAKYDDGTQVAAVAAFNEYGVPSHNQPPRPFFRSMIQAHNGQWGPMLGKLLKRNDYDGALALGLLGEELINELQDSIRSGSYPPLAPSTVRRKGFDTPLIDTAVMWRSIDKEVKQ